jgi:hypothetical protein
MRPYLVLCGVVLIAVAAFGQQAVPRFYGSYYGYGPYVPLVSTPMISFETVSPNPVGASNATTGLIAGATNSTLSQVEGSTSSSYTVAVWYQGGAPWTTPEVNILPEPIGRARHAMHGAMYEEHGTPEHPREEARTEWLYISGSEYTTDLGSVAKGPGKGAHSYTNSDVTRQNENNGNVHYDGKNEKIQ